MSLDLYEIGRNVILDHGMGANLDDLNTKMATLQDTTDKVSGRLGIASMTISELAGNSAGVAASWIGVAEAVEHFVAVADSVHTNAPDAFEDHIRGALGNLLGTQAGEHNEELDGSLHGFVKKPVAGAGPAAYDQAAMQFELPVTGRDVATVSGVENSIDALEVSKRGFVEPPAEEGLNMLGLSAEIGRVAPEQHRAEAFHVLDNHVDDESRIFKALSEGVYEKPNPLDQQEFFKRGSLGVDGNSSIVNAAAELLATEADSAFGLVQAMAGGDEKRVSDAYDPVAQNRQSVLPPEIALPQLSVSQDANSSILLPNAFYTGSAGLSSEEFAAEQLLQNGRIRWQSADTEMISDTSALPFEAGAASRGADTLGGYHCVMPHGSFDTGSDVVSAAGPELGRSAGDRGLAETIVPRNDSEQSIKVNAASGGRSYLGAGEDVAAAAGPPGWLVALTSAVVLELGRSAFPESAGAAGRLSDGPQRHSGPSGTRNDPMHVKLVAQMVPYQTHMPSASTASMPSQSLPFPGQVLFSP